MTGDDDRERILAVGGPDCSCRTRGAKLLCEFAISAGFRIRYTPEGMPDSVLKRGTLGSEWQIELSQFTTKIGGELLASCTEFVLIMLPIILRSERSSFVHGEVQARQPHF